MDTLSGLKDVDHEILLLLSDKDLIRASLVNKYFFSEVCDGNFFYRRLFLTYPQTLSVYNIDEYKNYRKFYLHMIFYISKMKENYDYSYVGGNPEVQYKMLRGAETVFKDPTTNKPIVSYQDLFFKSSNKQELYLMKEAVKRGANVSHLNNNALRTASYRGNLEILLENGADISANDNESLRSAIYYGHLDIVNYLIEKGADISATKDYAIRYKVPRILEYFALVNL
jgi:hypothetical protein